MDTHNHRTTLAHQPKFEVSEIFRNFGHLLEAIPADHAKIVRDIMNCRTSVLGGHRLECDGCDHQEYSYNSCRNRHCPKCQFLSQARWIEARTSELLPIQYFHVVFTVPHELNPVLWCNKRVALNVLFKAMSPELVLMNIAKTHIKSGVSVDTGKVPQNSRLP